MPCSGRDPGRCGRRRAREGDTDAVLGHDPGRSERRRAREGDADAVLGHDPGRCERRRARGGDADAVLGHDPGRCERRQARKGGADAVLGTERRRCPRRTAREGGAAAVPRPGPGRCPCRTAWEGGRAAGLGWEPRRCGRWRPPAGLVIEGRGRGRHTARRRSAGGGRSVSRRPAVRGDVSCRRPDGPAARSRRLSTSLRTANPRGRTRVRTALEPWEGHKSPAIEYRTRVVAPSAGEMGPQLPHDRVSSPGYGPFPWPERATSARR